MRGRCIRVVAAVRCLAAVCATAQKGEGGGGQAKRLGRYLPTLVASTMCFWNRLNDLDTSILVSTMAGSESVGCRPGGVATRVGCGGGSGAGRGTDQGTGRDAGEAPSRKRRFHCALPLAPQRAAVHVRHALHVRDRHARRCARAVAACAPSALPAARSEGAGADADALSQSKPTAGPPSPHQHTGARTASAGLAPRGWLAWCVVPHPATHPRSPRRKAERPPPHPTPAPEANTLDSIAGPSSKSSSPASKQSASFFVPSAERPPSTGSWSAMVCRECQRRVRCGVGRALLAMCSNGEREYLGDIHCSQFSR